MLECLTRTELTNKYSSSQPNRPNKFGLVQFFNFDLHSYHDITILLQVYLDKGYKWMELKAISNYVVGFIIVFF